MYKILLAEKIDDSGIEIMSKVAQVDVAPNPREETLVAMIPEYDAMVVRATKLTENIIAAGKKLKIVGRHGVGRDNLDIPAATRHGVLLITTPGANAGSVAEHTVGAIMYLLKQYRKAEDMLRGGAFDQPGSLTGLLTKLGFENQVLEGKTVALVGVGAIARRVADICTKGFGMRVLGYGPTVSAEIMASHGVEKCETIEQMLPLCDVLSIHVPKTPQTENMINKDTFAKMKPSAVLINTARGGIVNEADLVEALKNHVIAGAALDVYEKEPPSPDGPLFQLDNVLLTPHIGAASDGAMINMASYVGTGIVDYLEGREPKFMVNPEVYVPIDQWEGKR